MIIYCKKVASVRVKIMNISMAEGIDFDALLLDALNFNNSIREIK